MSGLSAVNHLFARIPASLQGGGQEVGGARATGDRSSPPAFRDELRESAEQLVASALLMPVLEQMTNSPLRPEDGPFAESVVEKRFGPLLHQHLADRMMHSRSFGLVDAVVDRLSREGRTAPAAPPKLEVFA